MAEIVLGIGLCVVLIADLYISDRSRDLTYLLTMVVLAVTAWVAGGIGADGQQITFSGSFVVDPMARVLKLIALIGVAIVFLYSRGYLKDRGVYKGEYFLLGLSFYLLLHYEHH